VSELVRIEETPKALDRLMELIENTPKVKLIKEFKEKL
jgi:hypothetical protein